MTLADCRFDWVHHGYDKCFKGRATFSDIDGALHLDGHFLFIEFKSFKPGEKQPFLYSGQLGLYEALAKQPNTTCWFIGGDMQMSVPWYIENIGTKESFDFSQTGDALAARESLRVMIDDWRASVDEINNRVGE
jgi:hypothetical protein